MLKVSGCFGLGLQGFRVSGFRSHLSEGFRVFKFVVSFLGAFRVMSTSTLALGCQKASTSLGRPRCRRLALRWPQATRTFWPT